MVATNISTVPEADLHQLKEKLKEISDADIFTFHNDCSLKRYLKAFGDIDIAFNAILRTNKWRKDFNVNEIDESDPAIQKQIESRKAVLLKHTDLHGRPVLYISARFHSLLDRDMDDMRKFIVYSMEQTCSMCQEDIIDNICLIFNLQGFSLTCMDLPLLKTVIWILSYHYPERLGSCLVLNAPFLFTTCWSVIKGFLNERTLSKIHFITDNLDLSRFVVPEMLPSI